MSADSARLTAYLDRIGLPAAPPATVEGLSALVARQRRAIAFENLDIPLSRGIRIDADSVFDKLVTRRRGGYCFEQNRLLADMGRALGFIVRPLLARVRLAGLDAPTPSRTHVTLLVELDGTPWIADAGFGGSDVPPLPLAEGAEATSPDGATHRLRRVGEAGDLSGEWLLERASVQGEWQPQYSFDLAKVADNDLEQCNHWTATRPGERFTSAHIVSIVLPDGFASLTDRALTVHSNGESQKREIADAADYAATLRTLFGLDFSDEDATALSLFA